MTKQSEEKPIMIQSDIAVSSVAHVIQLSVAPVFLLTGVGAILGVITHRLARIIDRGRALEGRLPIAGEEEAVQLHRELAVLSRRARLANWSISLCTTSAFLVCSVIVVLFLEAFVSVNAPGSIALLFIAAMLALIAGLLLFLREIYLATASLRIGPQ
jgi:hypothetical protein